MLVYVRMHGYRLQTDAVLGLLTEVTRVALTYAHLDASLALSVSKPPIQVRSGVGLIVDIERLREIVEKFNPLGNLRNANEGWSEVGIPACSTRDVTSVHVLHIATVECAVRLSSLKIVS